MTTRRLAPLALGLLTLLPAAAHAQQVQAIIDVDQAWVANDTNGDGSYEFFTGGTLETLTVRRFDGRFADTPILGFDTSAILDEEVTIDRVVFNYDPASYTTNSQGIAVSSFGYLGNLPTSPVIGTDQGNITVDSLAPASFELNAFANLTAGSNNKFGLQLIGIDSTNISLFGPDTTLGRAPTLTVYYTPNVIPEPTTLALLTLAAPSLLLRRRRHPQP